MSKIGNRRGGIRAGFVAFLFVAVCTAGGALVAGLVQKPLYRSSGLLRLASDSPTSFAAVPNTNHAKFRSREMASALQIIRSRRIADAAVQSSLWKSISAAPPDADKLLSLIQINNEPDTDLIEIACAFPDARVACCAVNSMLNSYDQYYSSLKDSEGQMRMAVLMQRAEILNINIAKLKARKSLVAEADGALDMRPVLAQCVERLSKIENALTDLRIDQATGRGDRGKEVFVDGKPASRPDAATQPAIPTDKQRTVERSLLEFRDQTKRELLSLATKDVEHRRLEAEMEPLKSELDVVVRASQTRQTEALAGNALSIISFAEIALERQNRWRTRPVAWVSCGSGGVALLLVLLIAMFDHKQ